MNTAYQPPVMARIEDDDDYEYDLLGTAETTSLHLETDDWTGQEPQREKAAKPLRTGIVEPFCPKLDIRYLYQSRFHQLKSFIHKRVRNEADAEDLAQNTYIEAIHKAANFKGQSRPDVWLFGIALNLVRNHRKKESNRYRLWEANINDTLEWQAEPDDPCDLLEKNQILARINRAAERLPQDMRQVLEAVVVENRSYQETAAAMDIPTGTIRSRLSRAREQLRLEAVSPERRSGEPSTFS